MAMHATKDNRRKPQLPRDRPHRELVNRPLQLHKRSQLFIRTHNETLSIVAMCVCNPDRLSVGINR
jgi:hypothetical protein